MAGGRPLQRARGVGVTLLDLLLTGAVLAVVAGISVPLLAPRYREYQLRSAAWQVAGDLRLARQRAATTRARYRFVFADSAAAAAANSYIVQYAVPQGGGEVWVQEVPPAAGSRQRFAGPIHIIPTSTPKTRAITFNPNGSVVPTGTIRLTGVDGTMILVIVDQTGRVQVNRP